MTSETQQTATRAFGAESRRQLLEEYFASAGDVTSTNAWRHVYRLLAWIDRTTGLVHCYESDKSQPGRAWYGRSLAFHGWLAAEFSIPPKELGSSLDWLFRRAAERLSVLLEKQRAYWVTNGVAQRSVFVGDEFPLPGEDPEIASLINQELGPLFREPPSRDVIRSLTRRINQYISEENKRKNLVGEGFEDVLAFLFERFSAGRGWRVLARPLLHDIPGFRPPPAGQKPRRVDLAIISPDNDRTLVTAKWSVRADREEQFGVDFENYARLDDAGRNFGFVLVTNEFDAARLTAACERRVQNAALLSAVVHVNPRGVLSAYGPEAKRSAGLLAGHLKTSRLIGLKEWFDQLIPG